MKEECNQLFTHCFFSTPRVQSKLKKDKDRCSPHCQNYCIFPNKDGAMFSSTITALLDLQLMHCNLPYF